jgi:uncharacterized phage-like protein YoqJ
MPEITSISGSVVCFSGHRYYTAGAEEEARLSRAVEAALADGYRTFISGLAPGFDLAAAEAVVRLRGELREELGGEFRGRAQGNTQWRHVDIRLVAAVPFPGQQRGYSPVDRVRYETLIAAADEVRVLAAGYSHGCYFRRDDWMVERSGRIICWYDGEGSSGTRYTVRRALARGLEVVNIFRDPHATLFQGSL